MLPPPLVTMRRESIDRAIMHNFVFTYLFDILPCKMHRVAYVVPRPSLTLYAFSYVNT